MNTCMKKRALSLLLAFVLVLGVLPGAAWAAEEQEIAPTAAQTVVAVNFTAQSEGAFLFAPQFNVEVASDLAESYGYTDAVADGVSALDVLVKAHEIKYGGSFTTASKDNYLVVENGSMKKIFGTETTAIGFILNGGFPNDGVKGEDGYGGYAVNQAPVVDGDLVEFFIYQDQDAWLDNIVWFCKDGAAVDSLTAAPASQVALTLKGLYYAWNGGNYIDANAMHTQGGTAICGMQLAWVNVTTGKTTDISGCVTDSDDGTVTVAMPSEEGTYYLTVTGTDDSDVPAIMSLTKVVVDASISDTTASCRLTALSVADFDSNPSALTMTPAFDSDTIEYSVAAVEYQTAAYMSMCYVSATAESGSAIIKAKLNDGTEKTLTSGSSSFDNFGLADILQPGVNNKLVITVTNGGQSKTYTVTIPKKDEEGNLPAPEPGPSPEPGTEAGAVMDAIAARYAESGIASDAQAPWLAADMAAYAMAFPDTAHKLTDAQKQEYLDKLIPLATQATTPGDLAKYIIALRAMGYDARKVIAADGQTVDVVKKLTDLIDAQNTAVVNQYTLPYVLIALQQGEGYATAAQLSYLKEAAVSSKASWQNTQWGTDGATPMILALAPYYGESEIKAVVDEAIAAVKAKQSADGSIAQNAASTGLTMAALAAVGEDCSAVKAEGSDKSLVDGLMAQVSDTGDGFKPTTNTFGTEQGFRGLVAMALQEKANGPAQVYNFISLPMNTARASAANCPVEFSVVPADAVVEVKLGDTVQTPTGGNYYDLAAGSYTYTVAKSGYRTASGAFTVTDAEASAHTKKAISVSLISEPSGSESERDLTINVKVLTHDENTCEGKLTYKNNAGSYTVVLADTSVTVKAGQTAFDAFALAMEMAGISYIEKTSGYISEIDGVEEFGHNSPNSGWQYMIGNTLPEVSCRDYVLRSNVTMIWFYTDDYTQEKGSEQWSGGGSSGGTGTTAADTAVEVVVVTNKDGSTTAKAELSEKQVAALVKDNSPVTIRSDAANVTIPAAALKDESGKAYTAVSVEVTKAKDSGEVTLTVQTDGKTRETVPGGLTVQVPAAQESAGNVLVLIAADGSETIVKKSAAEGMSVTAILEGSCTVKVVDNGKTFADTADHWAEASISFVTARELFQGVGDGFSPNLPMDRAMLATVLYRLENAAAVGENPFGDVAEGAWYTDAVTWASREGIVLGSGDGSFAPGDSITREQLAAMLYRYAAAVGMDTSAEGDITGFGDAGDVSGWASDAMAWAVGSGLINGKQGGQLDPAGNATRAEVAVILERMIKLMVG